MRIGISVALIFSSLLALTSCGGGGGGDAPQPTPLTPGPVARLEVAPTAVLLTSAGQFQPLKVRAFDASGLEIPNPSLTFSSSAPTQITVSSNGVVTATSAVGSSLITVESGGIRAPPLLAVAAEAQPGAVLVADTQVVTGPRPLAGSQPGVGGRYTVELSGFAPPAAGSLAIASGSYPIAGKVVDSTTTGSGTVLVTLELVPLSQLFRNLSVSGQLTPSELAKFSKPAGSPMPPMRGLGDDTSVKRLATAKFGVFDCTTSFDPSLLTLSLSPSLTQSLGFAYDFSVLSGETKAFLLETKGNIEASITGQATVGAVTGTLDCAAPILEITVPITGWLSAFVAPQIPLGVKTKMDLSASTNVSYGINGSVSATVTFGIKQDALGRQVNINDVTTDGRWDVSPAFANTAARVRLSNFGGIYAGLTIGNIWGSLPNAVEVSAGLELASAWGKPYDAARDALFTTEDVAKSKASIGPGPGLQKLLDWASVVLSVDITFSLDGLLGQSPKQLSAQVDRSSFRAGDTVTFNVSLDPTTIRPLFGLGSYNVREVRIYRLDDQSQTATQVASAVAADGQTEFTIPWRASVDGVASLNSKPVFHAFLVPRFFDALRTDFPIELGAIQELGSSFSTRISASFGHTCAITGIGGVKCWGLNSEGQLGDGTTTNRLTPVDVVSLNSGMATLAAGQDRTCVLTAIGGVKCWGSNRYGHLGDGTNTSRLTPVDVVDLGSGVTVLVADQNHSCAVVSSGNVKCWGVNDNGQLGDGTLVWRSTPIGVVDLSGGQVALAAGANHTCALTSIGGVNCWGSNQNGQLGNTNLDFSLTPVFVSGLGGGVSALAAGDSHTCALTTAGGVKCWGLNSEGQLGDGTTTTRRSPADVIGLSSGVKALATNGSHTCAVITAGGVKCWGANNFGQLGDGTTEMRLTPVDVVGLGSRVVGLAAGSSHTCALMAAGGVKCWGANAFGELGDGTNTTRLTPVDVVGL